MDTKKRIKLHEGFSPTVYEDTLGYKTVGYGHLVTIKDDFVIGEIYSPEELEGVFEDDYKIAFDNAHDLLEDEDIPFHEVVESVLIEMAFQLGLPRLKKFVNFIQGLKDQDYNKAADEMIDSRWAKQTPNRAHGLSEMIRGIV
jgi:lysozyme|tara:strand:+ start:1185 stop:1613 length:429 start_codon:yes stop_codon:yes gene_type:complete